jgi:hypothetical protein
MFIQVRCIIHQDAIFIGGQLVSPHLHMLVTVLKLVAAAVTHKAFLLHRSGEISAFNLCVSFFVVHAHIVIDVIEQHTLELK